MINFNRFSEEFIKAAFDDKGNLKDKICNIKKIREKKLYNVKEFREIKFDIKEWHWQPNLVFNWVMLLGGFSV